MSLNVSSAVYHDLRKLLTFWSWSMSYYWGCSNTLTNSICCSRRYYYCIAQFSLLLLDMNCTCFIIKKKKKNLWLMSLCTTNLIVDAATLNCLVTPWLTCWGCSWCYFESTGWTPHDICPIRILFFTWSWMACLHQWPSVYFYAWTQWTWSRSRIWPIPYQQLMPWLWCSFLFPLTDQKLCYTWKRNEYVKILCMPHMHYIKSTFIYEPVKTFSQIFGSSYIFNQITITMLDLF